MAATVVEAERRLPYPAKDLCVLVGDVRAYPSFIPWLKSLRVTQENRIGEGWRGVAEAIVGWRAITEKFATRVRCEPETGEVDVSLVRGPLKTLENRWRFVDAPDGAHIRFSIAYEFKNPVLQKLVAANRETITNRILAAFEGEAHKRFKARL